VRRSSTQRGCAFAGIAAILAGGAMLLPLCSAAAADGKGDGDAALVAAPPAGADKTGLREPSAGGPLIVRGTRPELPAPDRLTPTSGGRPTPASDGAYGFSANSGFQPTLTGTGWNPQYDYSGLTPPVTPK
jgi:hypothetical protein